MGFSKFSTPQASSSRVFGLPFVFKFGLHSMAGFSVFSFTINAGASPGACKPYVPREEYWSLGTERIGYHDSEDRVEFYLKHESSIPATYDFVFEFEEIMDQRLVEVKRGMYDLLVMKYKRIFVGYMETYALSGGLPLVGCVVTLGFRRTYQVLSVRCFSPSYGV